VVFWNRGAEEIFGWRADEMIGKPSFQILCAQPLDGNDIEDLSRTTDDGGYRGEMRCTRKDGTAIVIAKATRRGFVRGAKGARKRGR